MARRRALVVWIDADAKHCGTCVHLEYVCTYGGGETTDKEALWYSPACLPAAPKFRQRDLFANEGEA